MVSNVLEIDRSEIVRRVKAFKKRYAADPEYKKLRAALPKDWPL
jgi:hypothetical protein